MATSAKRKQEETHLKMLREMTSLPANRKCFDCDQRGPTYVNMTVGSFVCTTCSGILRGLNPPHRVKSISMTTFTHQEIEFLQKHSNEVCKHIWLGLYDDRTSVVPDFREPQKVKEFLQEKYEKKRWYVPPDQSRSVQASVSGSSASSAGSTPEVQPPLKSLQLNKTPLRQSPGSGRTQVHVAAQEKKFDLLSDLGGDIFAAPPPQASAAAANFANFAHFPSQSGGGAPIASRSGAVPVQSAAGSRAEDRYAALAELDNKLGSSAGANAQGNLFGPVLGSSPAQNAPVLPAVQSAFGGVPSTNPFVAAASEMAANPFQANGRAPAAAAAAAAAAASFGTGSMSMPAGFGNSSSYRLPTSFSGNFQQQFPGQAPVPYAQPGAYHPQSNGPAFPVYGPNKPFAQPATAPAVSNNPFVAGAPGGPFPSGGTSTNPFL
ncbi:arf-GAP domain and FG repeat-containing protein 1b isoform X3 [Corythoichthys intestinalis]|uniref:arf-GAP domain and FG repeat-containing protein 1b isoform X3 n=1 Tax=Corythoichthys intestinalis TaxID=161448 RepID=UPI0025A61383|nr:arf-GAP domain and FG repeat-containing protein 1b isoform X3 [Corythoichthys intestinalis]